MNSSNITTLPHASFVNVPVAQNVRQMMTFDDQAFIYCAYRTLLRRDPDDVGMGYYLSRLRAGEKKMRILKELSASTEGRRVSANVEGLGISTSRDKIARIFGIGKPSSAGQQLPPQNLPQTALTQQLVSAANEIQEAPLRAVNVIRVNAIENSQPVEANTVSSADKTQTLWMDLTTSIEWTADFAGINTELQFAHALHKRNSNIQFCVQVENGFAAINKNELLWLLDATSVSVAGSNVYDVKSDESAVDTSKREPKYITVHCDINSPLVYPFQPNDIYFAINKPSKNKELLLSKIKFTVPSLIVGHYVGETEPIAEFTKFNFSKKVRDEYLDHVKWLSNTSNFLVYASESIKNSVQVLQKERKWRSPKPEVVRLGTDQKLPVPLISTKDTLSKYKIHPPYIFASAELVAEENYETIYKAFKMVLSDSKVQCPQLVISSKTTTGVTDLLDSLNRDPLIKGRILHIAANETEDEALRKNSVFVINPGPGQTSIDSLYHSLASGKTSLNADTDYAREVGRDMVEYVPLLDVRKWAEKIVQYSTDKTRKTALESKIKEGYKPFGWDHTAKHLLSAVDASVFDVTTRVQLPSIWLDVSTSYLYWEGGVAGIIRAELTFAKYLRDISPEANNIHFFAASNNRFFEVSPERLQWLFDSQDLVQDYKWFQDFWKNHHVKRDPFFDGPPAEDDPRILHSFPDNSVVLFTCIDWNMYQSRIKAAVEMKVKGKNILLSQLIYDMTPFLVPHLHQPATCDGFVPFVEYVSNNFDHLIYGGKTAMRDTIEIQIKNGWKTPISDPMEFGSDIQAIKVTNNDDATLLKYGVQGKFVLTVGTIEPRKNHETLYKAYLILLSERRGDSLPTLVVVGKRGWKFDDFLTAFENDDRVRGKIIFISPSDMELDVLYRKCFFTLLPSFYEGWSLTLPESLGYGKFCLTSKVDPLIETGGNLVDYIDPLDTAEWARKILFYSTHPSAINEKEENIRKNWSPKSWYEATQSLFELVNQAHSKLSAPTKFKL
jgi:glycosyltransferase involved in cell wall biosynthesis